MNEDTKNLLLATYQNTSTATQSIENCIEDIECEDLKKELKEQLKNYDGIAGELTKLAQKYNIDLKDNNLFEKARLWTGIKMTTLLDKSTRHYAEMFFIGSNMGVFNMICAICDNEKAEKSVVDIAQKLLRLEENYAFESKKYFCYSCN